VRANRRDADEHCRRDRRSDSKTSHRNLLVAVVDTSREWVLELTICVAAGKVNRPSGSRRDAARSADCRNIDAPLLSKFEARHRLVGALLT